MRHLDDSVEAIGQRLAQVRAALGMSKREFAEKCGLTEQTYGPFENARRQLSLEAAKRLRKTYGLSLEYLYFGNKDDLPHRIAKDL